MEDGQDELDGKISVDCDARFLVNANRRVALARDERAELLICQLHDCLGQIVTSFPLLTRQRANGVTAKSSQRTPSLRLETHLQRDCAENREASYDPADYN